MAMENKTKEEIGQGTAMTKEDFAALWKTIRLKVTDTYEVPPEILWVNGSTIGTLGNFSASTGKAKSKKTFNISAIVAAALKNDEVLKYSAYLPPNKRKILYVDTEQSKYHCHKVMERILRLAGLPTDKDVDDFVFIVLREQTPDKRKQIIGYMLENMPDVGLLIIDGIRDLMYDINSPSESTDLINLLMRWSSGYNLHIHTVLHLNKGDWQVFRFSYTVNGEDKGRPLDFMGFQFYRNRTVLRKSIMLKATRKARKIHKKPYQGRKPTVHDYRQMMSYLGWIDCTDTYGMYLKHIKPMIDFQKMKRYVSHCDMRNDRRIYEQLVRLYLPRGGKRSGTYLHPR